MMWAFIFMCILELNVCQEAGAANSTQMYYVKLTIDQNIIPNLTQILKTFKGNSELLITDLQPTTTCQKVTGGTECRCEAEHQWSPKLCDSESKCCGSDVCTFPADSAHMCVAKNTVIISGSLTTKDKHYQACLTDEMSTEFQDCNKELTERMKSVFSTFRAFDFLKIMKYSVGSVVVDFILAVGERVSQQDLITKSTALSANLSATFDMESTGFVTLNMPQNPVRFNSSQVLRCLATEDLKARPRWQLRRHGTRLADINDGTQSRLSSSAQASSLTLLSLSETWEGEYSCIFQQDLVSGTIKHRASAAMDVALLPDIYITTKPAFVLCQEGVDLRALRGRCEIRRSSNNYTVRWTSPDIKVAMTALRPQYSEQTVLYEVNTVVNCAQTTATLTCTFLNELNQTRAATEHINFIHPNDLYCAGEGDWGNTKAGFTAELQCPSSNGRRRRECSLSSVWAEEKSECVNQDMVTLLQEAMVVDIGIGCKDKNTAEVFQQLSNLTNRTHNINSFANLRTSVDVLRTLGQKPNLKFNETAVGDFLRSSSNLMDESLEKSWTAKPAEDNVTLGELYLSSVERLIEAANMTRGNANQNIGVTVCNKTKGSRCSNTAFNVTVDFDSPDDDKVTTVVFKQLEKYLPQEDKEYEINSHIVSTTTVQKRLSDSVTVDIRFPLHRPRPPNVRLRCVYWDNATRQWSQSGCEWKGPTVKMEGHCVCRHLSNFAVLMAKNPIALPGMTVTTVVGLSVSVVSLVITIAILVATWGAVVRTSTLYLRQTALINISVCLLVGDCCFLASHRPGTVSEIWCKVSAVLKHFCYLSMFFWMLCLSLTLLHQAIFLFNPVSKTKYLRLSVLLGYVCPLCIVVVTVLSNDAGAEGMYFTQDTCWLVASGGLKGSIHAFIIPVGIIAFINIFSMVAVIMKLLIQPHLTGSHHNTAKKAAKTVIRSVILLNPVFGVTWLFGFGVAILDLSSGSIAYVCNYAFILLNAFQGLLIFLTSCLGDTQIRDVLLKRFKRNAPVSMSMNSTTTLSKK